MVYQDNEPYMEMLHEAVVYLKDRLGSVQPIVGMILGSGLGGFAKELAESQIIPYDEIPYFPVSTIEGHAGRFIIGTLEGKTVIAMQGRFHYYEGYSMRKVVFPVYVMKLLGIQVLVITNAAGGMNASFQAGDLMLITDHLNMTGDNPLIGAHDPRLGVRFPDMSAAYDAEFRSLALRLAQKWQTDTALIANNGSFMLQEGVYAGISGPTYMTPVELTLLARLGGDAVGMSTVGEVIAARHCGLRVLGISCITDMALGEALEPLTHEQVVAVAERTKPKFQWLLRSFVREV